jgi:alkanesulfonate monooxygenase SsuD/methylene tetrahydromethanopterin reductase-like flavin-dependent oxidoreductase (luciferase family)
MREDGMSSTAVTSPAVTSPATGPAAAGNRVPASPRVGMFPPIGLLERGPETARAFLAQVAGAGIDHICCGDHVSFFVGAGFDGLVQATALAMLHPTLPVYSGVYLLPLRHPVLVARQLADIDRLAPGRLIFGVGVGGEDRHEVSVCGVDPATRGPADERMPRDRAPAADRDRYHFPRHVLRPR